MRKFRSSLFRRFLLLGFAALPVFGIGKALAAWYFEGDYEGVSSDVKGEVYFDDVRQNYSIGVNNYTVYFFPSRGYASLVQEKMKAGSVASEEELSSFDASAYWRSNVSSFSSRSSNASVSSSDEGYFGYWEENGSKSFGFKKMVVDTALTEAEFASIGEPVCGAKDKWGFPAAFAGWTTTLSLEMDNGLLAQGDYGLISVFDPLRRTDAKAHSSTYADYSIDGSALGDKVVFAYPIFTAGKDYSASTPQSVVRLHGDKSVAVTDSSGQTGYIFEEERYLSEEGTNNSAMYRYENLVVGKESIFYLDVAPTRYSWSGVPVQGSSWSGTWFNYTVGDVNASNASTTKDGIREGSGWISLPSLFAGSESAKAKNSLFVGEGVYNVYVYLHFYQSRNGYIGDSDAQNETFKAMTKESKALLFYQDPNESDYRSNCMYINDSGEEAIGVFLKVEKVEDVRLIGKNNSLSFENGTSMFKSRDGSVSKDGKTVPYVDYQVNNVHIEGTNTAHKNTFVNDEGNEYAYKSNCFSALTKDIDLKNGGKIDGLSYSETLGYNEAEAKDYSGSFVAFTSTDAISKGEGVSQTIFEEGVGITNFDNPENCPFYLSSESSGYRSNIFRMTADSYGYYNVLARLYYAYSDEGNAYVFAIGIALAVVSSEQVSVWVFDGAKTDASALKYDANGFVDIDNSPNLVCIVTALSGTIFAKDLSFTPVTEYGGIATVNDLLEYGGGRKLIDHQLGYELRVGSKLRINHVVFLVKK